MIDSGPNAPIYRRRRTRLSNEKYFNGKQDVQWDNKNEDKLLSKPLSVSTNPFTIQQSSSTTKLKPDEREEEKEELLSAEYSETLVSVKAVQSKREQIVVEYEDFSKQKKYCYASMRKEDPYTAKGKDDEFLHQMVNKVPCMY